MFPFPSAICGLTTAKDRSSTTIPMVVAMLFTMVLINSFSLSAVALADHRCFQCSLPNQINQAFTRTLRYHPSLEGVNSKKVLVSVSTQRASRAPGRVGIRRQGRLGFGSLWRRRLTRPTKNASERPEDGALAGVPVSRMLSVQGLGYNALFRGILVVESKQGSGGHYLISSP